MSKVFSEAAPVIKLQISVMSARGWSPMFGHDYGVLAYRLGKFGIANFDLQELYLDTTSGQSLIQAGRCAAVKSAIDRGCTHLLMLDDDMRFPHDLCDIFFNRRVPVIASNCLRKRDQKKEGTATRIDGTEHNPFHRADIEEAAFVGTGIILINLNAIRHLPEPLFDTPWMNEKDGHLGEDFYFCKKARDHGVKVYIDNLVSQASAHMGEFAFHWGNNHPLAHRGHSDMSHMAKPVIEPEKQAVLDELKELIK